MLLDEMLYFAYCLGFLAIIEMNIAYMEEGPNELIYLKLQSRTCNNEKNRQNRQNSNYNRVSSVGNKVQCIVLAFNQPKVGPGITNTYR